MVEFVATLVKNKSWLFLATSGNLTIAQIMENYWEAFFVTGEPDTILIVSVNQRASYFYFPKGNVNNTTSLSSSQELSASLFSSAVLASHALSSESRFASTSLVYIGITVPDSVPSDG